LRFDCSIGIHGNERLEVIPAGEFFPGRTYGAVLRKGRLLTPHARMLVDLLLRTFEIAGEPAWPGNGHRTGAADPRIAA